MASPMSAAQFAAVLRAGGVIVVEVGNWETHNRNSKGAWGPVHGVMIHHTVTQGSAATVELCRRGHSALPGPLCHGVITKDGRVHLVGYGRANHAGLGDDDVLRAVIDEKALPADNEATTDGNRHFYGFECENLGDGRDPWPAAQLEAIEKVSAAICRHHGWSERSVIGHLEWQPGKVDPRGFTMASMRARIADRLADGGQEEDNMTLTDEDVQKVANAVWGKLFESPVDPGGEPRQASAFLRWADVRHVQNKERFEGVSAQVAALQETVDGIAVGGVDLDALAMKVADLLAARLAQ